MRLSYFIIKGYLLTTKQLWQLKTTENVLVWVYMDTGKQTNMFCDLLSVFEYWVAVQIRHLLFTVLRHNNYADARNTFEWRCLSLRGFICCLYKRCLYLNYNSQRHLSVICHTEKNCALYFCPRDSQLKFVSLKIALKHSTKPQVCQMLIYLHLKLLLIVLSFKRTLLKYPYIHGYFVASFPYFNGTGSVYTLYP